jgi:16S rRNA (uracil1498-N3)-methyltransferase
VTAPLTTSEVAKRLAAADVALVLHEEASEPLSGVSLPGVDAEIVLVIGPEGGVAPHELDAFTEAGAVSVRLGETVLRTSTAGVVAAAVVFTRTGRW